MTCHLERNRHFRGVGGFRSASDAVEQVEDVWPMRESRGQRMRCRLVAVDEVVLASDLLSFEELAR